MNGIRKTYLYVYGSQRLLDIRRVYQSAGLKRLIDLAKMAKIHKFGLANYLLD